MSVDKTTIFQPVSPPKTVCTEFPKHTHTQTHTLSVFFHLIATRDVLILGNSMNVLSVPVSEIYSRLNYYIRQWVRFSFSAEFREHSIQMYASIDVKCREMLANKKCLWLWQTNIKYIKWKRKKEKKKWKTITTKQIMSNMGFYFILFHENFSVNCRKKTSLCPFHQQFAFFLSFVCTLEHNAILRKKCS